MKKAISLILVMLLAFAICVPSFAANEPGGTTTLEYTVAASYEITIPENVVITEGTGSGAVSVNAGSLILAGEKITFTITEATNYDGGFKLVNGADATILLDYTIANDVTPVVLDEAFLVATAAEANAGKAATLTYTTDDAVAAGEYTDTITITVATVDA